jgi:hypothetical protein
VFFVPLLQKPQCFVLVKLIDLLAVANQSEFMKLEACAYPIKSVQ